MIRLIICAAAGKRGAASNTNGVFLKTVNLKGEQYEI